MPEGSAEVLGETAKRERESCQEMNALNISRCCRNEMGNMKLNYLTMMARLMVRQKYSARLQNKRVVKR